MRSSNKALTHAVPGPVGRFLTGQTALVTGAAGRIGSAIVAELLAAGAAVVALDRDGAGLDRLTADDMSMLTTITADLTDDAIGTLEHMRCDMLLHAAGIQHEVSSLDDTDAQWREVMETNVTSLARLMRHVRPGMIARGRGSIVLITSTHARLPSRWASYSASKAAQAAMVREWAVDLAPYGIRVNSVAPGWVDDEPRQAKLALLHGRTIPPAYVARAAVFLASDHHSHFTTGTELTLDAGMSLYSGRVPFDVPGRG